MQSLGRIEWLPSNIQSHLNPQEEWTEQWLDSPFDRTLQEGLASNSFSTIDSAHLPVDLTQISKAALKSDDEIWKESFGFAIMGRNTELLDRMMGDESETNMERLLHVKDIYPLHLATTYLDGGKTCCKVLEFLLEAPRVHVTDTNAAGFTVFDTLMITILRNHSQTPPEAVSDSLKGTKSFAGQEVDICGRWDAESKSYRSLIASGDAQVPFKWKHKFCHTSIQAVCHCLDLIFRWISIYKEPMYEEPMIGALFFDRCFLCANKMELLPLHTLVLTTFQLFKHGTEEEDLFGMICCLLRLVTSSPWDREDFAKIEVSTKLFSNDAAQDGCAHERLSPGELAHRLDLSAQDYACPETRKKGWHAFVLVLDQIEEQYRWIENQRPPPGYEQDHRSITGRDGDVDDDFIRYDDSDNDEILGDQSLLDEEEMEDQVFCKGSMDFPISCEQQKRRHERRSFGRNRLLGHIWAACQAELLTYRRQREGDSWLSPHIDIDMILECLDSGDPASILFVRKGMLQEYCPCGEYKDSRGKTRGEHACASYFSNLDNWHRAEYIED
jgi:hypothetical protein